MASGEISWWRLAKAARAVLPLMLEEENASGYESARRRRRSNCDKVVATATSGQTQSFMLSWYIGDKSHGDARVHDFSPAPSAPCTCPQPKRILLTFCIVGVREVAAVLRTSYICTPEGTTHLPFLKSWQIDMKLHASFLEGLLETCVVDFVVVYIADHDSQIIVSI